jgi:hypothetical protein
MKIAPVLAAAVVGMATVAGPAAPVRLQSLGAQVPVRLFLDQSRYAPGAEGHVRVQIGKNGYLLVLYAQPDGHVNVAYPLDPGVSDQVEADTEIEVLTRGGASAFTVEDSSGSGTWYAAISSRPFRLRSIAVDGHWDYRVIPRIEGTANTESELTSFVETVAGGRFDYDIVSFVIDTAAPRASSSAQPPPVDGGPPPAVAGPPPPPPTPWWVAPRAVPHSWIPGGGWWGWGWGWGGIGGPWAGPYLDRTAAPGTIVYAPNSASAGAPSAAGATAPPSDARGSGGDEHAANAPHEGHSSGGGSHSSGEGHGSASH